MGAVFEVLDERTDTRRALKVMHPDVVDDEDLRGRFEREARVTGGIESDHVVRVSDAGVDEATNTPFLVMELLRGSDLGAVISDAGRIAPGDVIRYLGQAALGLERAHAAGIVHRDLKPENLFLTRRDDGSPCVKVLDFGIAKIIARRTQAKDTRTMGTPTYMAPEQIRGEGTIGPAADVYALGHIAYALLVGQEYWSEEASRAGSMFSFFSRVVQGMPEAPSARAERTRGVKLGAAFDAWLRRAAAPQPEDRFAGAAAAVAALAGALGVEAPPALALEAEPTRRDLEPSHDGGSPAIPPGPGGVAAATTMGTAVGPRDVTTGAADTHDTVPMSVWSQTAATIAAEEPRREATAALQPGDAHKLPIAAPIAAPRPLARRVVGALGASAAVAALAWAALGTRTPHAPAPGARATEDAPNAGVTPSASPSVLPAMPSGEPVAAPVVPDAGARASAEAPPPDVAKPRRQATPAKPKSSATTPPMPEFPGLP